MLILGCFSHMGSVFINGHVVESLKVFVFKVPVRNIWIRIATEHGMQKSEDYSFKTFDDLVFFTKHIVPHQYFSFDHVEASHFELKDTRCPAELQCHDTIKNENKIMSTTCRLTFDCRSNNIYVATLDLFSRHKLNANSRCDSFSQKLSCRQNVDLPKDVEITAWDLV